MGKTYWSVVRCRNDGTMMAGKQREDGRFDIFCEHCWDSFVSDTWDGLSISKRQDTEK